MLPDFEPFDKIPRLSRDCVISEKLDGTNAQVLVDDEGGVFAGSRNRWITPEADNFGFARWVQDHADDLRLLGPGHHYGEWYGSGIQRGYGLKTKHFALFNTARWNAETPPPACCSVVPVLYEGLFEDFAIKHSLDLLRSEGSQAEFGKGFKNPEGIVIWHCAARQYFKKTLQNDEKPKGSKE
jgi:hypothetical protein